MYMALAPPLRQPWMSIGLIGSLDQVFNCAIIILCHHLSPGGAWGALAIEYPLNLCNNLWYVTERLVWQECSAVAHDIFCCVGLSLALMLKFYFSEKKRRKNLPPKYFFKSIYFSTLVWHCSFLISQIFSSTPLNDVGCWLTVIREIL